MERITTSVGFDELFGYFNNTFRVHGQTTNILSTLQHQQNR